jgi:hypothetical protein
LCNAGVVAVLPGGLGQVFDDETPGPIGLLVVVTSPIPAVRLEADDVLFYAFHEEQLACFRGHVQRVLRSEISAILAARNRWRAAMTRGAGGTRWATWRAS